MPTPVPAASGYGDWILPRPTASRPGRQAMIGWLAPMPASAAGAELMAAGLVLDLERWETVARGDFWARLFVLDAV